ncbi:MAG: tol-pal system protein YbgF [Nevskiales bacterium]|nr:tol-pal system protein YbgF [Nevskiales bacterium]
MKSFRLVAGVVCAASVLSGCASSGYGGPLSGGSDNLPPQERRLQAVESRLLELSRRLDAVNLPAMDQDSQRLRDDLRQLRGELERLRYEFDQSQRRSREQYLDLDRRLQRFEGGSSAPTYGGAPIGATVQSGGTVTTPPVPPPAGPSGSAPPVTISNGSGASPEEEGAYLTAFDALKNGKYDNAIRGFKTLLDKWPQGRYADNALYWTGEAYYVKRDYRSALDSFRGVLKRFPASPKAPDAMLKLGLTQIELKQESEGKATLRQLIESYPQSSAARLAQQRLGN